MEKYKEKVRIRTNSLSLLAVGTIIIYFVLMLNRDHLPVLPSFIKGFQLGAFIGLELFLVAFISKYMRARKDENRLKKMYIEENDERTGLIVLKAGSLGMVIISSGLGIATIIAGFFSATVFFTLMSALFFVLVVFYTLWVYFAKKL